MNEAFMRERPVLPLIVTMSLPMVLSMLVNSLYNIVDSFFVAQISEASMTALSLVYPIQNLVNALAIGFGVGLNAAISFYLGSERRDRASAAAVHGLALSAVHGVVLTGLTIVLLPSFLEMFTQDPEVLELGVRYGRTVFCFSLLLSLGLAYEKIFQAVGRMKVPMAALLTGCLTNIVLDPLLIFGPGPFPKLGIEGAALATGIGQTLTLLVYLAAWRSCALPITLNRRELAWDWRLDLRLYSVGIPATLSLALPSLLISALNSILSAFSPIYVVILGIYYKLQTFLYLPASGIVQGMRPVIGYNYGAGEQGRVREIYRVTLGLCAAIMAAGYCPLPGHPRPADGAVHPEPGEHPGGGRGAPHHQRGLSGLLGLRGCRRCAGGAWQGRPLAGDLTAALYPGDDPSRLAPQPPDWARRGLARLLAL